MPAERALGINQHSATRCGAGMLTPIYPTTYLPLFEHARCNNWPRGYVQCLLRSSFQLILTAFITLAWMQGQYTVCTLVPMLESIESPWGSADAVAWAGFISAGLKSKIPIRCVGSIMSGPELPSPITKKHGLNVFVQIIMEILLPGFVNNVTLFPL